MNHLSSKCLCGSGKTFEECCYSKYPSLQVKTGLDLQTCSKYEAWGSSRWNLWGAIQKQLTYRPDLKNGNIIIFGAGACTDLPIDYICDVFSEVVLVDKNENALNESKKYIPSQYVSKVSFCVLDITGVHDKCLRKIVNGEFKSYKEAVEYLNDIGRNLPDLELPDEIKNKMPFSFAISDLILTQLYADFQIALTLFTQKQSLLSRTDELKGLIYGLTMQHIRLLHKVTKDKGKVLVLADTFMIGTEIDGSDSPCNALFYKYGKALFDTSKINVNLIVQWMNEYPVVSGSEILYPIQSNGFKKFQIDAFYWWWWMFSAEKRYFVMCYAFDNHYYDVPLQKDYKRNE